MRAALNEESGPPAKKAQRYFSATVRAPAGQKHLGGFVRNFTFAIKNNKQKKKKIEVIIVGRKLDSCWTVYWASLVAQMVKRLPAMQETWVRSPGWKDPLEKEMATHSSTLAWKIPWMEEPGRLQSMGSQRV